MAKQIVWLRVPAIVVDERYCHPACPSFGGPDGSSVCMRAFVAGDVWEGDREPGRALSLERGRAKRCRECLRAEHAAGKE